MSNINDFINNIINENNISGGNSKKIVIPYPIEVIYTFKNILENSDIKIYDCTLELRNCYTKVTENYINSTSFIDKDKLIKEIKELFNTNYTNIISNNDIFCYYSADLYGCNIINNAIMIALYIPFELIINCIINTKHNKYKLSYTELLLLLSKMYIYEPTSTFEWNGNKILSINNGQFYDSKEKSAFLNLFFMNLNVYGEEDPPIVLKPNLYDKYETILELNEDIGNKIIMILRS